MMKVNKKNQSFKTKELQAIYQILQSSWYTVDLQNTLLYLVKPALGMHIG